MEKTRFDELFDIYVPRNGKCETLAGEVLRAAGKVMYRYYNDGDIIGKGYGRETCSAAARFLERKAPTIVKKAMKELRKITKCAYMGNKYYYSEYFHKHRTYKDIVWGSAYFKKENKFLKYTEKDYSEALVNLENIIAEYIDTHPEYIQIKNEYDMLEF